MGVQMIERGLDRAAVAEKPIRVDKTIDSLAGILDALEKRRAEGQQK
jgi:hypothetical protein